MGTTMQFQVWCAAVVIGLAGVSGCQTARKFAFFGKPDKPDKVAKSEKTARPATTRTVSHSEAKSESADERLLETFYESVEASRLGGTSISHFRPGRAKPEDQRERTPGPNRPRPDGPGMPRY